MKRWHAAIGFTSIWRLQNISTYVRIAVGEIFRAGSAGVREAKGQGRPGGATFGVQGAKRGHKTRQDRVLRHLGGILALSWPILAPSCLILARSWRYLGSSWRHLGAQDAPETPPRRPKTPQDAPKTPPRRPKMLRNGPRWRQLSTKMVH